MTAVVFLVLVPLLILSLLVCLPIYSIRRLKSKRFVGFAVSGLVWLTLICIVARASYAIMPGKNVIIARVTTPDGVELCVTHKSNYSLEPYTVSFYFKRPNQPWGYFYYDHQDTRWHSGSIGLNDDGSKAFINRGKVIVATFDLNTESFKIKRWDRVIQGAQKWMPEDWNPEDEIRQRHST